MIELPLSANIHGPTVTILYHSNFVQLFIDIFVVEILYREVSRKLPGDIDIESDVFYNCVVLMLLADSPIMSQNEYQTDTLLGWTNKQI